MGVDRSDQRVRVLATAMGAVATVEFYRWADSGVAAIPSDAIAEALARDRDRPRRLGLIRPAPAVERGEPRLSPTPAQVDGQVCACWPMRSADSSKPNSRSALPCVIAATSSSGTPAKSALQAAWVFGKGVSAWG